jgi:tRNA nucleotidyltransferase (CCA-adding enzyme)
MTNLNTILASIIPSIRPSDKERHRLKTLAQRLIERINSIGKAEGLNVNGILVGSSARGTWISGEHDLDIFIMFPPHVERQYLEEKGLYIARRIALEGDCFEERYAEHPYIHAVIDGFEVDLVPAFNVENAAQIKSAVDRTPFHNKYVASRIGGLEDDVLLLKQFQKGSGVYGSELKTHGFSGYLVELLVIYYGSFEKVLKAACDWKFGTLIDIENHGIINHKDPLIMIDPTDPARNVAAALSPDNMCIFMDRACDFLKNPDGSYFHISILQPLGDKDLEYLIFTRGTSLIAVEFEAPDEVEDVLFPQLYKLEGSCHEMLERYDFRVYNSGVWAKEKAIVLYELESATLPNVKKHTGPMVGTKEHASAFKSKYDHANKLSNVYIRDGKYMVEIPRKYSSARKLVESEILKCGLGKHIGVSMKKKFNVMENLEILSIKDEGFRKFLRRFFDK